MYVYALHCIAYQTDYVLTDAAWTILLPQPPTQCVPTSTHSSPTKTNQGIHAQQAGKIGKGNRVNQAAVGRAVAGQAVAYFINTYIHACMHACIQT